MSNIVIIDTETTGVSAAVHGVWEVALVPVDDHHDPLHLYIDLPQDRVFQPIAEEMFEKQATVWNEKKIIPLDAHSRIESWVARQFNEPIVLAGWNAGFDMMMLKRLAFRSGFGFREGSQFNGISYRTIDLHSVLWFLDYTGKINMPNVSSSAAFKMFNVSPADKERHTALGDAIATKKLLKAVLNVAM